MKTLRLTAVALMLTGVSALTAIQDTPTPTPAQPAGNDPQPWVTKHRLSPAPKGAVVESFISVTEPCMPDLSPGPARIVSVVHSVKLGQVVLGTLWTHQTRELGSTEPVVQTASDIHLENARFFAALLLGQEQPKGRATTISFVVKVQPAEGLTWGDVGTAADVQIVIEPL